MVYQKNIYDCDERRTTKPFICHALILDLLHGIFSPGDVSSVTAFHLMSFTIPFALEIAMVGEKRI